MKYTGAELIVRLLERRGIEWIPGIPGSANLPLYRALSESTIKHVLARHEQGAGFIAQGMARSTGRAAVCFATSGPGATNLLTAIADARLDSVPLVAITGQVATSLIGTDAFQEIDTYGLTIPITKHNFAVRSAAELLQVIPEAFRIATSGRPGPVVVDVPRDVQVQECSFEQWPDFEEPQCLEGSLRQGISQSPDQSRYTKGSQYSSVGSCPLPGEEELNAVVKAINTSKRPVVICGAGVQESGAEALLLSLVEKSQIPVACTMRGLGSVAPDHPLYLGMLGMHGTKYANLLIDQADLVLALGFRFDDRATGKASEFCRNARIIQVDIDQAEIGKIIPVHHRIHADVRAFLEVILPGVEAQQRKEWGRRVAEIRERHPYISTPENDVLHPLRVIDEVAACVDDAIITTDVGQHQMWVAMKYPFRRARTFLTSCGLGTMGFGIPAAIGAALVHPGRKVVCFSGDGSFLMNVQELGTMAELHVPVAVLLFDNACLGLVRQQQELFYDARYIASKYQVVPDYAMIARGFGITAFDLGKEPDPLGALRHALTLQKPVLVRIPVSSSENVFPMVPPGAPGREMIG